VNDTIVSAFLWFAAILVFGSPVWAWVILKILHKPTVKKMFVGTSNSTEVPAPVLPVLVRVFTALVILCVLLLALSHITTLFPESRWAYAMQYNTETQYVVIDPQPHDCEFFKAPIGNKYCHFNRTVSTKAGDASVHKETLVYVSWDKVPD
jgi:hypothetical protein